MRFDLVTWQIGHFGMVGIRTLHVLAIVFHPACINSECSSHASASETRRGGVAASPEAFVVAPAVSPLTCSSHSPQPERLNDVDVELPSEGLASCRDAFTAVHADVQLPSGVDVDGDASSSAVGARGGASRRYGRCLSGARWPDGVHTTDVEAESSSKAEKPKQPMYSVDHRAMPNESQTRTSHTL